MRKQLVRALLSMTLVALGCAPAFAQFPQKNFYASDYGQWQIPSQSANTYLFSPPGYCNFTPPAGNATNAFNTNAPILIVDATAANSEIVTPSVVTNTGSQCGITVSPANNHYSFKLVSGTAGLQEALNQIPSGVANPVQVVLDRIWYALATGLSNGTTPLATPASIINTVVGSQAAYLLDVTTVPFTFYSWNGTNYTPSASNVTAPSVAAGAGAGTSPTLAVVPGSTGTSGYITVTTGTTPTAAAAVFVLTWPAIASGGFQYAPSCTYTSLGTRAYAGTLTPSATAGPPATGTVTDSTALTASVSGYKFKYVCH